ncbi:MAG: alanine--tRNA ligase [Dehalococcoidia bacterium]
MTSDEIRESFLSFFESKGHLRMQSSSLIPVGDPTLLLTIAGMNQFKSFFSGQQSPPNKRLTSSQKCFRTPDIDIVGDSTHNTLFEMLGNFSIGDYFKKDAIAFALEFLTKSLKIPVEKFDITIHETDDEAFSLWKDVGIPQEKIHRFGDSDNWWGPPIHGEEGPCGPCSELHYDFGENTGCLKISCGPNCENIMSTGETCNRFVELWNLVFMQYYHSPDGSKSPLPAPSIDTGMGLERATLVMQNASTMYETDIFKPLVKEVLNKTSFQYGETLEIDYAIRAVAEHSRSATFLIADGVVPSNEGRGYVLRRVIRRAIRLAMKINIKESFMQTMAEVVISQMQKTYPELNNNKDFILSVLELEEERFKQTYENGYTVLEESLTKNKSLSGAILFQLWDTYGFPIEVTQEIASEKNIKIDLKGFQDEMEKQRTRARESSNFSNDFGKIKIYEELNLSPTTFVGYDSLESNSTIIGIINKASIQDKVSKGDEVEIILDLTPFYSEGGGQVGDNGKIFGAKGTIEIYDTKELIPEIIIHYGKVTEGEFSINDMVSAEVDRVKREDTARNHTATHMLHAALREVLGSHVRQAGSLVTENRLRFDFSHMKPISESEMSKIQSVVNRKIRENMLISRSENTYAGALEDGALAFFGDKYGEKVRLIEIANGSRFSFEVCGGTHAHTTGELGAIYIIGESSIGAGMRRIEAVSGREAENLVQENFQLISKISDSLNVSTDQLEEKIFTVIDQVETYSKQIEILEEKLIVQESKSLLETIENINGINLICTTLNASSANLLRKTGDSLKTHIKSGVIAIGSIINENPMIIIMVTKDLADTGVNASEIAKKVSEIMDGGGGGKSEIAQAGGKSPSKLNDALSMVSVLIKEYSSNS